MDPLSIGSAVVGLVVGGGKMIMFLRAATNAVVDAPKSATAVLQEVVDIGAALGSLQAYLIGAAAITNSRAALVSLENIVATLTGCVKTYSQLDSITEKCTLPASMGVFDRAKWAFYEDEVDGIVQRLQRHKLSLVMMLQILQGQSQQEVNDSVRRLIDLVEASLQESNDLRARMISIQADHSYGQGFTLSQNHEDDISDASSFERDLESSRVYGRLRNRHSLYSLSDSQRGSMALSAFSELSLGSVSKLSVLSLPIWSVDLANSRHYLFGQAGLEISVSDLAFAQRNIDQLQRIDSSSTSNSKKAIAPDVLSSLVERARNGIRLRSKRPRSNLRISGPLHLERPNDSQCPPKDVDSLLACDKISHIVIELGEVGATNTSPAPLGLFPAQKNAANLAAAGYTTPGRLTNKHRSKSAYSEIDNESDLELHSSSIDDLESRRTSPNKGNGVIFDSAIPVVERTRSGSPHPEQIEDRGYKVLFLAASLFEFHFAVARKEAGFPYLKYKPGELFDIIGMKGELWLARNQDDASETIGWVWDKHFARLTEDEPLRWTVE